MLTAAHGVEVLQQSEVRGPKAAEVFPGGDERLLDGLPGSAGRVLSLDLDVCHVKKVLTAGAGCEGTVS